MNFVKSPFHLVENSPWPILGSFSALFIVGGLVQWFHFNVILLLTLGMLLALLVAFQWWRDIVRESTLQGSHTQFVVKGLKSGMILFIASEVMLFFSFFWAFFHSSLVPAVELGESWPPNGVNPLSPVSVPLLNTLVLLSSGVTVTWAHHSLLSGNLNETKISLFLTILLGMYFTVLQAGEYLETSFSISDSVYGASFFIITGFHGVHVIVGTLILLVSFARSFFTHFSKFHHFGFEAAAWYWHFVDVVWLLLFMSMYVWGA